MYALTNNNKKRHAQALQWAIFTKTLIKGRPGLPDVFPVIRVGNYRTAEGAAFVMSDDKYVGKVIFYNNKHHRDRALKEFDIGSVAGAAGVGPKYYAAYELAVDPAAIPGNLMHSKVSTNTAILLLMENLGHNAQKVESLIAYAERTGEYPIEKVNELVSNLAKAGIGHGDLHNENILVRTERDGSITIYAIDFGFSIFTAPGEGNLKNSLIATQNYGDFVVRQKRAKAKTPSPPKAKTPTRLPKNFFRHTTGCA